MIVIDDAAVRADGDVDTRLLVVFVTLGTHVDECRCLSASDALRLARNADGTAADADLDKVCPRICEETEALTVHDVARANLDRITELLADVLDRHALPLGEPLRGVDAENIDARVDERRNAFRIVACIDACTDDVALVVVGQLQLIFLVVRVVLAEHHIAQALILVDERQHVELVLPDEIVGERQGGRIRIGPDELLERRHERMHFRIERHAGDTVVTARHDADELAVRGAVFRDRHGRMSRLSEKIEHPTECRIRTDVRVTADKARFIVLHTRDHRRLCLDGLRAIDERYTALLGEGNRHRVVGDCLHDRRGQRDIHRERRLFITTKFDERRAQGNICGEAFRRGVAGYEQILSERMRRFSVIMRQENPSFPLFEESTEKIHPFISAYRKMAVLNLSVLP